MKRSSVYLLALLTLFVGNAVRSAEDRNAIVRSDRDKFLDSRFWVYNDLEKGFAEAAVTGKPMLVVFRCVP